MIASARMYGVTPGCFALWRRLFGRVAVLSGVELEVVDHAFPAPLIALWRRADLACGFMCGWPFIRGVADVVGVAAPIMADPIARGRPVYWSDIVVRVDDPAGSIGDLRGGRVAYTVEDSQSGFNALRGFLRGLGGVSPLFAAEIGPVFTPRGAIEAVVDGRANAAPVDSYAHALLRRHLPELAGQVRVIARTPPSPAPLLVAAAGVPPGVVEALRKALLRLDQDAEATVLLEALCLAGFATPLPAADYAAMDAAARDAEASGIHRLELASLEFSCP